MDSSPSLSSPSSFSSLKTKRWVVPVVISFVLCSLLISTSLLTFSSSRTSTFFLFSFYQITNGKDDSLFVEPKLAGDQASPRSPVPRIAYLVSGSAGDGPVLRRTLRALYHPANFYAVHLDLEASPVERLELSIAIRSDRTYARFKNVRVVKKANLVTYRGPTMVTNTLHAAAILLKEAGDWDWFINLSASDYPLVTQDGQFSSSSSSSSSSSTTFSLD